MPVDALGGLDPAWTAVVVLLIGLALAECSFFVTTVYLHRTLAHRALTLSPQVATACRVLIWVGTGTRPRQWVAVHRKHHAFTDVEGDPHSPVLFGYAAVQFGNAYLYRKVSRNERVVARYARDLPANRWDRCLFDHALLGLSIGVALLVVVFGWVLGLLIAAVYTAAYLLGGGAINAIGHSWGRRPHGNRATNNQWLAWLVAGEGLHNNHHAAATSARLSLAKGEVDPGWWIVRLLACLRLASVRHAQVTIKTPRQAQPSERLGGHPVGDLSSSVPAAGVAGASAIADGGIQ